MTQHSCTLMEKYISLIKRGDKTVEARVAIPMFKKWKVGDRVRFFSRRSPETEVVVKIVRVEKYKSFREMLEVEDVDSLIPGVSSVEQAEREYLKIPKYAEREKLGVMVFGLERVSVT